MVIFKPFKIGDDVTVAGVQGTVQEIQILNTVLNSLDNVRIIIPNSQITGGTISNYTANATRRIDLTIGVSYDDDIKKAKQVIEGVLAADARILKTPAPTVAVSALADSSVNFVVRPWVKSADYWDVYFDTTAKLKTTLESNGITIPFPQREISIKNAGSFVEVANRGLGHAPADGLAVGRPFRFLSHPGDEAGRTDQRRAE